MKEIERRTLLGASGALLALAACVGKEKDTAKMTAPCENYGDYPNKGGDEPPKKILWRPLHYCVVYINLDAGQVFVRHAYYETGLTVDQQDRDNPIRKAEALAALNHMARNRTWPGTPLYPEADFDNFWFGSQQEIYVLIDGSLAEIDENNLIVFSSRKTKPGNPEQPKMNDTFYNAHVLLETINGKKVMFFQNWFVEDSDSKIKKRSKPWDHKERPAKVYAMNIHMLLGAAKIPGVIDPDTGNGAGNEP